jgi:hypothetical protein
MFLFSKYFEYTHRGCLEFIKFLQLEFLSPVRTEALPIYKRFLLILSCSHSVRWKNVFPVTPF